MEHNEYEEFLLGYATVGELPEVDSVTYVSVLALAYAAGLITGFDWDTDIGAAVKQAIDAQSKDFRENMAVGYLIYTTSDES